MSSRSRYTSPVHAGARFVAQRGLLKPLVWRLVTRDRAGRGKSQRPQPTIRHRLESREPSRCSADLRIHATQLSRYVAAGAAAPTHFFDVWWRKGLTSLFFNAFPVDRTGLRRPSWSGDQPARRRRTATALSRRHALREPARWARIQPVPQRSASVCDVPCLPMAIVGASEAMPYGQNWPSRGRLPVFVAFGSPCGLRTARRSSSSLKRITKEVSGLIDYATTYRANQASACSHQSEGEQSGCLTSST